MDRGRGRVSSSLAENRDRCGGRAAVLVRGKAPPERHLHAEQREVVPATQDAGVSS